MSSYFKRLKKKVSKVAKSVGTVAIKAVKYAAPAVGTIALGPAGGAAGSALSGVAATHRAKNKTKAFFRSAGSGLVQTAAITAVTPLASSVFGSAAKVAAGGPSKGPLDNAFLGESPGSGGATSPGFENAFLGGGRSAVTPNGTNDSASILGALAGAAATATGVIGARAGVPNDIGNVTPEQSQVGSTLLDAAGLSAMASPFTAPSAEVAPDTGGPSPILFIALGVGALFLLGRRR